MCLRYSLTGYEGPVFVCTNVIPSIDRIYLVPDIITQYVTWGYILMRSLIWIREAMPAALVLRASGGGTRRHSSDEVLPIRVGIQLPNFPKLKFLIYKLNLSTGRTLKKTLKTTDRS